METVRSSESLEAQILEDARAKARRVIEAAGKEGARIRAEAQQRDLDDVGRLDAAREARLSAMRADLEATVPLDLKRLRLSYYQGKVVAALEELFTTLAPGDRDRIIGDMVARAAFAFTNQRVVVRSSGITPQDGRRIVAANVTGAQVLEAVPLPAEEAAEAGVGLILETADRSRRLRATLRELVALLLDEYREPLLKALFGKDVQT